MREGSGLGADEAVPKGKGKAMRITTQKQCMYLQKLMSPLKRIRAQTVRSPNCERFAKRKGGYTQKGRSERG